jgi:hypothetical protein
MITLQSSEASTVLENEKSPACPESYSSSSDV